MKSPHVRNIALDLVFTLLTFGLFNVWVQYKQIIAVNEMIKENKYSFWSWAFLTLITFGIYHFYHEYRKTHDICRTMNDVSDIEPLVILLVVFVLFPVADAIQQTHINRYYGSETL